LNRSAQEIHELNPGHRFFLPDDCELRFLDAEIPATDLGEQHLVLVSSTATPRSPSSHPEEGSPGPYSLRGAATLGALLTAPAAFVLLVPVIEAICAGALVLLVVAGGVAHLAGWSAKS
jgi:hypothetical protein